MRFRDAADALAWLETVAWQSRARTYLLASLEHLLVADAGAAAAADTAVLAWQVRCASLNAAACDPFAPSSELHALAKRARVWHRRARVEHWRAAVARCCGTPRCGTRQWRYLASSASRTSLPSTSPGATRALSPPHETTLVVASA